MGDQRERRRWQAQAAKCGQGVRGVGDGDRFVVEFIDPSGKRRREKVGIVGKPGKRAADRRADQVTGEILAGTFETKSRATWAEFRAEYESKIIAGMEYGTRNCTRVAMAHFERIIKPARMDVIISKTFSDYVAKRRAEPNAVKEKPQAPPSA